MNQKPTFFSEAQKRLIKKALTDLDLSPYAKSRMEEFAERKDISDDTILFCSQIMTAAYGKHDLEFAPTHLERELMKYQALTKILETLIRYV